MSGSRCAVNVAPSNPHTGINALTLCEFSKVRREELRPRMIEEVPAACRARATSTDYWDLATRLELACHTSDEAEARAMLPRVLKARQAPTVGCPQIWKPETTRRNLSLLLEGRKLRGAEVLDWISEVVSAL